MWWRLLRGRSPSPISRAVVQPLGTDEIDPVTNTCINISADEICSPADYATTVDEVTVKEARRRARNSSVKPTGHNNLFTQVNTDRRGQRSTSVPPYNSQVVRDFDFKTLHFRNPYENEAPTITLYTDGSCIDQYSAGFGVFFGVGHPLNISRQCGPPFNSSYAEIMAAHEGLKVLKEWPEYKSENVKVRSDYLSMIRSLLFPSPNERFGPEICNLRQVAQQFPRGVMFEHVYGHRGEFGNEEADALARLAVGRGRSRSRSRSRNRSRSRSQSRDPPRNDWHNRDQLPNGGRVAYVPPLNPISSEIPFVPNESPAMANGKREDDGMSGYDAENHITQTSEFHREGRSRSTRKTANSLMHP